MKNFIPQIFFFLLVSFFFSWSIWIYGIYSIRDSLSISNESFSLFLLLGSFGPTIGSIFTKVCYEGFQPTIEWLRKSFRLKIGLKLFLYIIFVLNILVFIFKSLTSTFGIEWYLIFLTMVVAMPINFLPGIISGIGPLGEELGWRGFLSPIIFKKFNDLKASVIVGCIWTLWHAPIFIFSDWRPISNMYIFVVLYTISLIILAWVMQMIYTISKGKVLATIIMHSIVNTVASYGTSTDWWTNRIISEELDFVLYLVCFGLFGIGLWYLHNKKHFFDSNKIEKIA